ncbi:hypothetical protein Mapa_004841 [Marchantia paleacea]|nr:hypothetical protein Mapa_004841 [Marchantia paleacea]
MLSSEKATGKMLLSFQPRRPTSAGPRHHAKRWEAECATTATAPCTGDVATPSESTTPSASCFAFRPFSVSTSCWFILSLSASSNQNKSAAAAGENIPCFL